ncbi:MAG: hypothetical protein KJ630_13260, partial [Proteobacteria bacterium]|nr:hypothetical protein [Pseudomonadota bacterium]
FTGKEYEKDLGIMYFGARYYNPHTTRWLSPDPLYLVVTAKNAESDQNIYQYAGNNPYAIVDKNGLEGKKVDKLKSEPFKGMTFYVWGNNENANIDLLKSMGAVQTKDISKANIIAMESHHIGGAFFILGKKGDKTVVTSHWLLRGSFKNEKTGETDTALGWMNKYLKSIHAQTVAKESANYLTSVGKTLDIAKLLLFTGCTGLGEATRKQIAKTAPNSVAFGWTRLSYTNQAGFLQNLLRFYANVTKSKFGNVNGRQDFIRHARAFINGVTYITRLFNTDIRAPLGRSRKFWHTFFKIKTTTNKGTTETSKLARRQIWKALVKDSKPIIQDNTQ